MTRAPSKADRGVIRIYGNTLNDYDNFKTFATNITQTCQQVLQNALKKFGIKGDWKLFTLFMHFKEKERSLRYNEIPLLLKRSLRDTREEPHFSIRNIRQFDENESMHSSSRDSKAPKDFQAPVSSSAAAKDKQRELNEKLGEEDQPPTAVGIYEYVSALDDEISIGIGDAVKVLRRATGWWYVQQGTKMGWAPAGCLDIEDEASFPPPVFSLSVVRDIDFVFFSFCRPPRPRRQPLKSARVMSSMITRRREPTSSTSSRVTG